MIAVKGTMNGQAFDVYFIDISPEHMWNFPALQIHSKWRDIEVGLNDIWEIWNNGEKLVWYCALCKKEHKDTPTWAAVVYDGREVPLSQVTPMVCLDCSNRICRVVDTNPPDRHLRESVIHQRIADRISELKGW